MFLRLTTLIIFYLSHTKGIELCDTNCTNFVQLNFTISDLKISTKEFKAKVMTYPKTTTVSVMTRKIYRHILKTGRTVANTVELTKGSMLPDAAEAQTWYLKKMCQVGSICKPYSDCYGGGLDHCKNLGLNPSWVKGRSFEFEDSLWLQTDWSGSTVCIQDWECHIDKHTTVIYLNSDGTPYVKPGNHKINITDSNYYTEADFGIYIANKIIPSVTIESVKCVNDEFNYYCECIINGNLVNTWFKKDSLCKVEQNMFICLEDSSHNKLHTVDPDVIVTADDLNVVRDEVVKFIGTTNYNNLLIQNEMYTIKNFINKLVLSTARYNPFILKDILGMNVYVQKKGMYLRACPCKFLEGDCDNLDSAFSGTSHCSAGNAPWIDVIKLKNLENLLPGDYDFRGREQTVYEDEEERDRAHIENFVSHDTINNNNGNGIFDFLHGFGTFSQISSFLPYINLFIILLIVIGRR